MTKRTQTTIEHIEVACNRSYDQVTTSLKERLGTFGDSERLRAQLPPGTSWAQIEKVIEGMMGSSGLAMFHKVEHGDLLSVAGKPRRISQYSTGNPLLALRMVQHVPGIAFYAPFHLAIYDDGEGKCVVAYDRFSSALARYQHPEIASTAQVVEQKLETLVAEITGERQRSSSA
jgi:uncharacterized protein (DUF302 family)